MQTRRTVLAGLSALAVTPALAQPATASKVQFRGINGHRVGGSGFLAFDMDNIRLEISNGYFMPKCSDGRMIFGPVIRELLQGSWPAFVRAGEAVEIGRLPPDPSRGP